VSRTKNGIKYVHRHLIVQTIATNILLAMPLSLPFCRIPLIDLSSPAIDKVGSNFAVQYKAPVLARIPLVQPIVLIQQVCVNDSLLWLC